MSFREPVQETVQRSGLDAEQIIVVGGAVLGLHEIRKATDVDLLVAPQIFSEVEQRWQTPGGIVLKPFGSSSERRYVSYGTPPKGCLALDLLTVEGNDAARKFNMLKTSAEIVPCEGGILRALSLQIVRSIKQLKTRNKDRQDIILIDEYLSSVGSKPVII